MKLLCQLTYLYLYVLDEHIYVLLVGHGGNGQVSEFNNSFLQPIIVVLKLSTPVIQIWILEWWLTLCRTGICILVVISIRILEVPLLVIVVVWLP